MRKLESKLWKDFVDENFMSIFYTFILDPFSTSSVPYRNVSKKFQNLVNVDWLVLQYSTPKVDLQRTFHFDIPGIDQPHISNLSLLTGTFRYDTLEVENGLYRSNQQQL